jgi:hypothetical protein
MRSPDSMFALFACLLMASCASVTPANPVYLPPDVLMQECPEPALDASTNGGLIRGLLDLRQALAGCNADKRGLREWANTL